MVAPAVVWYWVDTGWACGGVAVCDTRIVDSCPIFRKWVGSSASLFLSRFKHQRLGE